MKRKDRFLKGEPEENLFEILRIDCNVSISDLLEDRRRRKK